jgi:hypothetical protein
MTSMSPHLFGLNLRHLGYFLETMKGYPCSFKLLYSVITARIAKSDLKEILRHKMREIKAPTEDGENNLYEISRKNNLID